jgi:hypothetical protein
MGNEIKSKLGLGFINIVLCCLMLFISHEIIVNNYDDNINYSLGYKSIIELPFSEGFFEYKKLTGANEPVLFLYSYAVNSFLSYEFSILAINILFLFSFYKLLQEYCKPNYRLIFSVFILSNSYLLVLLSDAHRLKLAVAVFFFYLLSQGKSRYIFLFLSVLSHSQILIFVMYKMILLLAKKISRGIKKHSLIDKKKLMLIGVISLAVYFNYEDIYFFVYHPILNKVSYYFNRVSINYIIIQSFFALLLYVPYFIYRYTLGSKESFRELLMVAGFVFFVSVVLGFFRLNIIVFAYIFIIELDRFFSGNRSALLPVSGLLLYNMYNMVSFIHRGLFSTPIYIQ